MLAWAVMQTSFWTVAQPAGQAVALVGSHARNAATAASDIDLLVITKRPEDDLRDTQWVQLFGQVCKQQVEEVIMASDDSFAIPLGKWSGTKQLCLSPDEESYDSASTAMVETVAQGQFVTIAYTWALEGEPPSASYR